MSADGKVKYRSADWFGKLTRTGSSTEAGCGTRVFRETSSTGGRSSASATPGPN